MKKNIYNKLLIALSIPLLFSACSEDIMDNVNNYDGYPKEVQTQFLIPGLITNTAFNTVGGDFSTYASIYIEHEGGVFNQLYNAEMRTGEPTSVATYNNTWNNTYANIKTAKTIIKATTEGEEKGSNVQEGIARILLAYNGAILTDLFGDTPYSEAGVSDANGIPVYMQAKLDKQEDIYKDVFSQLDQAIELLKTGETGPFGLAAPNDYIYRGSADKWIKAAYALKARYTMRLIGRSADKTQDLNNILDYVSKSFTSSADAFSFTLYDGSAQVNPLAALTFSVAALGASQSFADKLIERNDPRATQMYAGPYTTDYEPIENIEDLVLVTNGKNVEQSQSHYSCNITDVASSAPTLLMSYHELLFLKAEALARLNRTSEAETALQAAISAGFANLASSITKAAATGDITNLPEGFNLSSDIVSSDYFKNTVKALFDANPLKEIMIQKYLAMNGANGESIEAYNDIRRMQYLGENFVELKNPLNAQKLFPNRYVYGSSDKSSNENVKDLVGDGTYVYSSKVWWAGGDK